jgi:hypothetical protein
MKQSFEFPVEEMPWTTILRDCSSNEEKIFDYRRKIREAQEKMSAERNLKDFLAIFGLSFYS